MTGKIWLLAGVAIALISGTGCVCCGNKSYAAAREVGANCEQPTCQRNQVYVFAVGGMSPSGLVAIEKLREDLNRRGFAKVGTGQAIHTSWMARQMREIHAQEPDAVFVILGLESGSSATARLASRVEKDGLPIAAVVYLHDDGSVLVASSSSVGRTHSLGHDATASTLVEAVDMPLHGSVSHASEECGIASLARLLNDIAQTTPAPTVQHVSEWWFQDAPPARPLVQGGSDHRWAFLFDTPGSIPGTISEPQPVVAPHQALPVYTSAVR